MLPSRDTSPEDIRQRHRWRAAQVGLVLTLVVGVIGFWLMLLTTHAATTGERLLAAVLVWPVSLLALLPGAVNVPIWAIFAIYFVLQFAFLWAVTYFAIRAVTKWALRSNSTPHPDARASAALDQPPSARAGERGREASPQTSHPP